VAAFAEEEFESAKAAFEKGLPVAGTETQSFKTWIRKCQAEIEEEGLYNALLALETV
jgi:hypothetical protein